MELKSKDKNPEETGYSLSLISKKSEGISLDKASNAVNLVMISTIFHEIN